MGEPPSRVWGLQARALLDVSFPRQQEARITKVDGSGPDCPHSWGCQFRGAQVGIHIDTVGCMSAVSCLASRLRN